MKRIIYFYGSLLWSMVQAFAFGCFVWTLNEYIISNPNPKEQADIVAVILMAAILLACVWIDSIIRKYNEWYAFVLSLIASPIRFVCQIVTIVKFHQSGCDEDFAPRGGYGSRCFSDWTMYVLFSTISLSMNKQYKKSKPKTTYGSHHSGNYTGPYLDYDPWETEKPKKRPSSTSSTSTTTTYIDVYSDEYQSRYWRCKDCRYYTTYKKEIEGFMLNSIVEQGLCSRSGLDKEEWNGPCSDFVKK